MRALVLVFIVFLSSSVWADLKLNIRLDIQKIEADPYFKPYVAVWIETEQREPLSTLALWYQHDRANNTQEDGKKWLKDLRQWWRKVGRAQTYNLDAVTGATRRPGSYTVSGVLSQEHVELAKQKPLFLHIEAVREEGGRSYHRVPLNVVENNSQIISAKGELGQIQLDIVLSQKLVAVNDGS